MEATLIRGKPGSKRGYTEIIQQVYDLLENDRVGEAVMACLRLARLLQDYLNAAIFLRETGANNADLAHALYPGMQHLKSEVFDFVVKLSLEHHLRCRTLDFKPGTDKTGDRNILVVPVGEFDSEFARWEGVLNDLKVPPGMTPYDTAFFTDSYHTEKAHIRLRLKAIDTVKQRIKVNCYNYAVTLERQIAAQQNSQSFLEEIQNEVNNYFKAHSDDVFTKLQKAAQLVDSQNPEDLSLLLTQVRRAIKAAANFFYPSRSGKVTCSDGKERDLSDDQYLNRLHEYLATTFSRSSGAELLGAELKYLSAFARRLNDLACKGVHADVCASEAKQGLVGLYMFLYNVIANLQREPGNV